MKNQNDPAKEVKRRIDDLLKNPPRFDKVGNEFPLKPTYRQAFDYVLDEDWELAAAYAKTVRPEREYSEKEIRSIAAGKRIVALVTEKIKADKSLSYSEALTEVQRDHKNLILEYLGR